MHGRKVDIGVGLAALVGVLLAVTGAYAGEVWVAAGADGAAVVKDAAATTPELTVTTSDENGLSATIEAVGLTLRTRDTKVGEFVEATWPDASIAGQIGTPALPVVRRTFIAPADANVSVSVDEGAAIVIDSETAGMTLRLMPVQPPIPKLPGAAESALFRMDERAYGANVSQPTERATVQELGIVRGRRLFLLEVRPVAYNPVAQRLMLWPKMEVTVHFEGGQGFPDDITPLPGLERTVLNPEEIPMSRQTGSGNYLIIVASAYESGIGTFESAKAAQGYNVTTVSTAVTGTTNTAIKSYIQGLYDVPATRPAYVLLVGDTNTIPHWVGGGDGNPSTDLPYTCMDGTSDWHPDIAIGRFPVRSLTQLNDVVGKTLYLENGPLADPEYLARAVFMASADNWTVSEGTHNWVISNYMEPNEIVSDKLYCHTYGATTQQVRDAFNDGRLFGIYSGHGAETYWADGPVFYQSDVRNLFNNGLYPFVCSFACLTGSYTMTECFCETWILEANKAAAAVWGSSVTSYWTEDDVLEKKLFVVLYDDDLRELGPCFNLTRLRYEAQMGSGSTTRRYFEMYNLLGEPSLSIPYTSRALIVTPPTSFESEGPNGGPFVPTSTAYELVNDGDYTFDYEVTHDPAATWLTLSGDLSGTLAPTETAQVTVAINNQATSLENGNYTDTLYFTNTTDNVGDTARMVSLEVGTLAICYNWSFDAAPDPAWTAQGQWQFGQPTGGGSHDRDPTSGHTGTNVYGYNLSGDYPNGMSGTNYLTTAPIDCTGLADVQLRFWRWLGVESATWDHAYVQVSNDGAAWTTLWQNPATSLSDASWAEQDFDISSIADDQPTVYIRWGMGPTDGSVSYPGWNIDDVEIRAQLGASPSPSDFDGDGDVDLDDFAVFSQCFAGADNPPAAGCPSGIDADLDGDGDVDLDDFGIFGQNFTGAM